jgi:uncharacterized membrane protein
MEPHMGHFVLPGEPLASVWFGPGAQDAESREKILRKVEGAFTLGGEWTLHQDLERALVELSDIAVRALSPSLNDPTTAVMCVDRLGEVLVLLGRRRYPSRFRSKGNDGIGFIAQRLTFERAVGVSFEKIRHYGARAPSVAIRLIQVCGRIAEQIPPHRHEPLRNEIRNMLEMARKSLESSADLERLEEAANTALR